MLMFFCRSAGINETFCLTYGDGVADVNLRRLINFHYDQKVLATLTAFQPPGRFGAFTLDANCTTVSSFREKPNGEGTWVNGGFFVLEPGAIDYIEDDSMVWEREPLQGLAADRQLAAYRHQGFWQPMDTLRDKVVLENLWQGENPPWRIWD